MKPWYVLPEGRSRLARDRKIAAIYAPHLIFGPLFGKLTIHGKIDLTTGTSGIVRSIPTRIEYPDAYPLLEPLAFVEQGLFEPRSADRHFRGDGSCCLWYTHAEDGWNGQAQNAFEHFLQQLLVFFDRQLTFDAVGEFPGPVWAHDRPIAELYLEHRLCDSKLIAAFRSFRRGEGTRAGAACPCGRAASFENCHLEEFMELRQRLSGARFGDEEFRELERKLAATNKRLPRRYHRIR